MKRKERGTEVSSILGAAIPSNRRKGRREGDEFFNLDRVTPAWRCATSALPTMSNDKHHVDVALLRLYRTIIWV
jgi:hypothetical protein